MLKWTYRCILTGLVLLLTGTAITSAQPPVPPLGPGNGVSTDEWAVVLAPGANAPAVAQQLGFQFVRPVAHLPNTFVFRRGGSGRRPSDTQRAAQALANANSVVFFQQQIIREHVQMAPTDEPQFPDQWHLQNTGQLGGVAGQDANVVAAWNAGYTGAGAQVVVVDDGVEYTHPDFTLNYTSSGSYDYWDNDSNPFPVYSAEAHGHAAAGVIAAADNGTCGSGVAYETALANLRTDLSFDDAGGATILSHGRDVNDVYSNSWGWGPFTTSGANLEPLTFAAMADNAENGRGGLGNIYVFAAGNYGGELYDFENANRSGYNNARQTISVAASTDTGERANYSEFGTSVFVNAPSSGGFADIYTTDRTGSAGYSFGDCADSFGGTSASTPLVAGIVALMLDANPNLTWRDVQYILAETAQKNEPGNEFWFKNSAGYDVNLLYGFGRADAGRAAVAASAWANVPDETIVSSGVRTLNQAIPDNTGTVVQDTVNITQDLVLEHVEVTVDIHHSQPGDIEIALVSPAGTLSYLMTLRSTAVAEGSYDDFTMMSVHHWGEASAGTWKLMVADSRSSTIGTLVDWELKLYGVPVLPNDKFNTPAQITSLPFNHSAHTVQTTSDSPSRTPSCGNGHYRSLWYRYVPQGNGVLEVTTAGSNFDTVVSVWHENGTQIGCNNNAGGGQTSTLAVPVKGSNAYHIMINGNNGAFGNLVLNITGDELIVQGPSSITLQEAPVLPDFSWESVQSASQYRVFLRNTAKTSFMDEYFTAGNICSGGVCTISHTVNYTSLPTTGLPDGNYEWWFGAKLSSGTWLWSDTITFTVDVPGAQVPGNIAVNPADGRIAVSFDDDPETTWVQIWIGTVPPISSKSYNKWHGRDVLSGNSFTCDGSRCTIYPVWDVGSLASNGSPYTFSVWMRAWGPGGYGVDANGKQWVQMQNPGTTFTLPTQPATAPSNPHTPNPGAIDPQINWTGGANATWYRVYIVWAGSNVPVHNSWHSSVASGCSGALGLATDNGPGHYNCAISGLNLQNKLQQGSAYDIWMTAWGPGGKSGWVKGATFQYGP